MNPSNDEQFEPEQDQPVIQGPEVDAPEQTQAELAATQASQDANTDAVNNPGFTGQKVPTDEIPAHLAPQMHQPYPEKPIVQVQNEALTNQTPTGYAPHDPALDLDKAQLESQEPSNTDSYHEAENRVKSEEEPTEENTKPTEIVSE